MAAGPNTFAEAGLDRASAHRRDESWVSARLADPASRALLVGDDGAYVDEHTRPALIPIERLGALEEPILLGLDSAGAVLALAVDGRGAPAGLRTLGLRDAGALMPSADAGLLAYATAMVNWHRAHPHCARCGARTTVAEAGFLRRCPECGASHFPRIDPVVIMLVHDGERVLLGRQAAWPEGRYSTLAGFVEPGESLEEAVAREVGEEASIEVADVTYSSSQPWPFPASLMLGFHARHAGGEPVLGDGELADVRWFERSEVAAIAGGEVAGMHLPPPLAIARRLIDEWLSRPGPFVPRQ